MLSEATQSAWAKSYPMFASDDELEAWLPLWRHLDDTFAIAARVWDRWAPPAIQQLLGNALGGTDQARTIYRWLASIHDIGKLTPAFAVQVPRLSHDMRRAGLPSSDIVFGRQHARHELAGQLILEHWLQDRFGYSLAQARSLAVVVGGHHGSPPTHGDLKYVDGVEGLLGTEAWRVSQRELLDRQLERSGASSALGAVRDRLLSQPAQAALMGLVIFADWLASNPDFFPLTAIGRQPVDDPSSRERDAEECWRQVGFDDRWSPSVPATEASEHFASRFPGIGAPRPVQVEAIDLARSMNPHGVLVIEAPMGEGKTEAALLAAEVLAQRTGASGVFVALPTQATANSMFRRTAAWAQRLGGGRRTVHLAHGKAWLDEDYDRLLRAPIEIGPDEMAAIGRGLANAEGRDDGGSITALRWLAGRYRTGLADIVVGTIDQVLMAALQAKFVAMRHLALAGKVIVLDEVHAVDVYMSEYLEMALEWLGSYGAPVILLSATLPASQRGALLTAYRRGADRREASTGFVEASTDGPPAGFGYIPGRRNAAVGMSRPEPPSDDDVAYPILTASALGSESPLRRALEPSGRTLSVNVDQLPDDLPALANLLREALADGGCALVLRDTVTRVHQTADYLRTVPELADAVRIAHAQFLSIDRVSLDRRLAEDFGPAVTVENGGRPHRAIVIATQVVEQSLDVDFDLLVTDIAPVDLVLQRLGRIHRHAGRTRPAPVATPRAYVTGFGIGDDGPEFPRGITYVYPEYLLAKALEVLMPKFGQQINLPGDIAPMVQQAYSEASGRHATVPEWAPKIEALRVKHEQASDERRDRAKEFRLAPPRAPGQPLCGWVRHGVGSVDETPTGKAQVRDGTESIEVVVASLDDDGQVIIPPWIDDAARGRPVSTDLPIDVADARALARCTLRLPAAMSAGKEFDRVVAALEGTYFAGWQSSQHLKNELVLVLDADRRTQLAGFEISYSPDQGLKVAKNE